MSEEDNSKISRLRLRHTVEGGGTNEWKNCSFKQDFKVGLIDQVPFDWKFKSSTRMDT